MAVGTSNYPTSTDTTTELVEAANNAADTLGGAITAISTSLTLADSTEFTNSGIVAIDNELLSFTGKSGNTLTGLTRGIEGTTAASHSTGAEVKQVISAKSHNVLASAIIALENKLGTGTDIAWSVMAPLTASRVLVTDGAGDVTVSGVTSTILSTTFGNQTANTVFAGPTTGSAASPAFRSLVAADIPALSYGDVTGPSTATDNAIVRFDTTTGKLIQNSLITLSDAGALSFPDGVRQTFNPNGTNAGINVGGHTSDPSSATNGDLWYNSTANQLKTRRGATTEVVATIPSNLGDEIPVLNATTGNLSATGEVFWDGSGNALQVGNASTGALRLVNATGTDSFTLLPPASGGAVALTLPPGIGSIGQALTSDGTGGTSWSTITAGVSSVSGTSPVVSSGGSTPAISLASGYGDTQNPYASKTANHFLAAPDGTAGAPTFRAIVAADIPTLNQNTTGTASNVTGTVAIANGGTGATTAGTARTNLGATTVGGNLFTLTNPSAVTFPRFNADNTISALTDTAFRTAIGAGTVTGVTASSPLSSSGGATPNLSLGTVPVANGGTGVTAVSSGQLLIGTSAGGFAASTLTAGSNVTITNGSGAITIAASSGATPGGSDTQVQFNDGGSALGGDAGFTYNKTTNTATVEQLNLGTAGSTRGILRLRGNTSGEITVQPAATAGTYTLTLPQDDGSANQVLTTDGSGVLSWSTPSSGAAGGQFVVKNTSGATANANDVGYIDSAGEYKTTNTPNFGGAWCVVVTGAANGSNITVARRGQVTVKVASSVSAGDRLVTSSTAGSAQGLAYDHYNMFAVVITGGTSTCEALLYTGTNFQTIASDEFLFRGTPCDLTNFRATIKSLTSTSVTFNTPLSGTFNAMSLAKAVNGTQLTYMLLYNETRGTFRKIELHTDGSDTVTVLSATDSWAVNDTCTIASQTTVFAAATNKYATLEFKNTATVPAFSRGIQFIWLAASTLSGTVFQVHPHEALGNGKVQAFYVLAGATGSEYMTGFPIVALVDRKISFRIQNSSTGGTLNHSAYLGGVFLAVP